MHQEKLKPSKNLIPFGIGELGRLGARLINSPLLYNLSYGIFVGSLANWFFETVTPDFSRNHPHIKRIAVATSVVGGEAVRMLLSGGVYNPFTSRIIWTLVGALAGTYIKDII